MTHSNTKTIINLFESRGQSQYGSEAVSQLEHALQAALLAEQQGAPPHLIAAALLHDVGHLIHDLPEDAPDRGIDDAHELLAAQYLAKLVHHSVIAPIRLHVESKRYLCATKAGYFEMLSQPSIASLELQGGPMSNDELSRFEAHPAFEDAIKLRHWDDEAKVAGLPTPDLNHFIPVLEQVVISNSSINEIGN